MSDQQLSNDTEAEKRKKKKLRKNFTVIALSVAIVLTSAVLLHVMFSANVSELTIEILAAVVAVVMVVASVAVTLHFQSEYETEREFKTELFRQRLDLYHNLLVEFSKADDDNHISPEEITKMKNLARSISLIASTDVIVTLANYIRLIDEYGSLYITEEQAADGTAISDKVALRGTFRNLVTQMREDLMVVEGRGTEVTDSVALLVSGEGWKRYENK